MAAPSIPNLKELLGTGSGRGLGRGRGRSRGGTRGSRHAANGQSLDEEQDRAGTQDAIVQRTDEDAAGSRLSAVNLGYLSDDYAACFYRGTQQPRRFPIINRGTYVRTTAIDRLINSFLCTRPESPKQIISLGAGTDTRFFRMVNEDLAKHLVYHEIDFNNNTAAKVSAVKEHPSLLKSITRHLDNPDELVIADSGSSLQSPVFNIHPVDLRTITTSSLSRLANLSSDRATLLLSECCLVYLTPDDNESILKAFMDYLTPASAAVGIVIYEPIRPNDAFGRTMVSNLASRGIHMPTLQRFESLSAQRTRLKSAGFDTLQAAADIDFIYNKWTDATAKAHVATREMMDELEEWTLLATHYCVVWGARDGNDAVFTSAWENLPSQRDDALSNVDRRP